MVHDLSYCRVCLRKTADAVNFLGGNLDNFNKCTHLHASINDNLPNMLCLLCKADLKIAIRFLEKAKETDRKLRDALLRGVSFENLNQVKDEDGGDIFADIKTEFINCAKDPLEDSDAEKNFENTCKDSSKIKYEPFENLSDDDKLNMDFDGDDVNDADYKASDSEEDDENKPLIDMKKKTKQTKNDLSDSSDSDDNFDDFFATTYIDDIVKDAPNTPENAIFPKGRYMCKICKKTYFTEHGLKSHITIHLPKPRRKKNTGHNSSSENNVGENQKTAEGNDVDCTGQNGHDNNEDNCGDKMLGKKKKRKAWACHVCGKNMISASKLRYHMVMHTGEKDFLCTQCPKAYSTIYALQHHMRTHTGERPYECQYCGDKFTRPTTLKSHMRRHTGERPYGCDICGKRFIQHSSMTTHMKLNHMEKKIECPHCDKKYARQSDLNMHLVSHSGDKPFACSYCPSRFIRQANLNKHISVHHQNIGQNKSSGVDKISADITPIEATYQPAELMSQHISVTALEHQQIDIQSQHQENQVDTINNLLVNVIDTDRGRSEDEILRWGWSNNT